MTQKDIFDIALAQAAADCSCSPEDFLRTEFDIGFDTHICLHQPRAFRLAVVQAGFCGANFLAHSMHLLHSRNRHHGHPSRLISQ